MNQTTRTATTTRTLNARTARLAHEFVRLNTKFSKQNLNDRALSNKEVAENARQAVVQKENREFPELEAITAEDVAHAVLEKLAYERKMRKAAQREAAKRAEAERKARLVECPACGIKRRDPSYSLCGHCARLARIEDEWQAKAKPCSPTPEEVDRAIAQREADQRNAAAEELFRCYLINQLPRGCKVVMETEKELRIQTPIALFILHAAEAASVHDLSIDQIDEGWDADTVAA